MPNPIPIVAITNLISTIVLVFLNVHFFKKVGTSPVPSVRAFSWFFICVTAMMFTISLPGLVVTDPWLAQTVGNISTIFFFGLSAFFFRFIMLFLRTGNRFLTVVVPSILVFLGVIVFIWQMIELKPAGFIMLEPISGMRVILYEKNIPNATKIITGLSGLLVFGAGTLLFSRKGVQVKDPILRRRAFFIGGGCAMAVFASIFNYILAAFSVSLIFIFFASIGTLVGLILVYTGVLIRVEEYEI